ncbi:MAG TPA: hypothetical protein VLU23_13255 [Pseudolabrys sp.]|jgi:hypothetical protein|nr:hypothetical protein [Pseudolabrys sp.]
MVPIEVCVPLFSYFLVVGSVLAVLLFYADAVMVLRPLPFGAQRVGLPESYIEQTSPPHLYPSRGL